MKLASMLGLLLVISLACGRNAEPAGEEELDERGADASATLALGPEASEGLETSVVASESAPAELAAVGRVLDPAPLVEAAGALRAARLAAAASQRDLERTRLLARDQANASERELAAAELANAQASAGLAAAEARAFAAFGTRDAARIGALSARLASGAAALARIELPAGAEAAAQSAREVRVSAPAFAGHDARTARVFGLAGALDASLQTAALLVTLEPALPAGAALEARLSLGAPLAGVWLPEPAVLWNDGRPLAFVATGDGHYQRRALTIGRPLRDGYLVTSGLTAGERAVTSGAQQLLSTELVGVGGEAD